MYLYRLFVCHHRTRALSLLLEFLEQLVVLHPQKRCRKFYPNIQHYSLFSLKFNQNTDKRMEGNNKSYNYQNQNR